MMSFVDIVDMLFCEHTMLLRVADAIEECAVRKLSWDRSVTAVRMAGRLISSHADVEDDILFSALAGRSEYAGVILDDHRNDHFTIRKLVREAEARGGGGIDSMKKLVATLRSHFEKEEAILFPMAQMVIPEAEMVKMGETMKSYRSRNKYGKAEV